MSEGLVALKELQKHHYGTLEEFDRKLSIIEKELKALEIIIEKRVDVSWLYKCFNFIENCSVEDEVDYYNNNYEAYRNSKPLTLEEYVLLKEVLNKAIHER